MEVLDRLPLFDLEHDLMSGDKAEEVRDRSHKILELLHKSLVRIK
jgi:hypothetical protein